MEEILIALKEALPKHRAELLNKFTTFNGEVRLVKEHRNPQDAASCIDRSGAEWGPQPSQKSRDNSKSLSKSNGPSNNECYNFDVSKFLSLDDCGQVGGLWPTPALHSPVEPPLTSGAPFQDVRNQPIASAALQRQRERSIRFLHDIDGVPIELAIHLLDLHWNCQYDTFLLTYRPAFMRDLISGGPYNSKFLVHAVFASASKYSTRIEVRDNPSDPRTSGACFFRRCAELLIEDPPVERSSIPTVVGLLLLGSAFLARGDIHKSWMYSGIAIRMVYDLGLHMDCRKPGYNAEDLENRRRVFWGAFICDKLQSLYLGRPVAMQLQDSHVSHDFMDTMEDLDLWTPYVDPKSPEVDFPSCVQTPAHSVSTFQQLCLLSKLMAKIIKRFYFDFAKASNAQSSLQSLDEGLSSWYTNLPSALAFQPWSEDATISQKRVAPNIIVIHTTYYSLVILLHRPFMSDGNLRLTSPPANSWKKCTIAARNITSIMRAYRSAYTLREAPNLASYAAYVACTIHVRNAALEGGRGTESSWRMLEETLVMLDELSVASPCISGPTKIIRRLMEADRVHDVPSKYCARIDGPLSHFANPVHAVLSPNNDASPIFDLDAIANMFPPPFSPDDDNNNISEAEVAATMTNAAQANRMENTMADSNMMDDSLSGPTDAFDPQAFFAGGSGIGFN